MAILINFAAFQVAWFAAVMTAAREVPWVGALVMSLAIAIHLFSVRRPSAELALILLCGTIGAVWDSLLVSAGWVAYPSGQIVGGFAPYWIVAMWMLFATTLNISLGWLKNSPAMAATFGLVGGPLAYYTGQKLGGILFVEPTAALIALGLGWAALMPVLLKLAETFNGVAEGPALVATRISR